MNKTLILFLLISIINSFLFAQNSNSNVIDSLIAEGNYTLALEKANSLVEKDSLNANSWMLLGKTNRLNQRYNDAILAYNTANALSPGNKSWILVLAKTYKLSGNQVKAAKTYEALLKLDSLNTAAQINLSNIYLKQSKFKKAFGIFEQLHLSDTLNSEYVRQMGFCKYKMDEVMDAFELYKQSYELNNKNLKTIIWLANIYSNSQKYDTATKILDLAITDFPDNGSLYASRGNVSFKRSHHYRSVNDYKKAIELEYHSPWIQKKLAQSLFAIEEYKESKVIFELLIVRDTADFQVCNYLGNIYNKFEDYDKALMFFEYSTFLLTPEPMVMASIYSGMSKSYAGKGQYYKQIDYIKKRSKQLALKHPGYPRYSQFLEIAKIYEESIKDKKMSLKYYQKYWDVIKDWNFNLEHKEQVLAKINHLKEDLHFQN
ncbi:MAG: tetratricopeptide repeat protein [Bacteroidota bacterium]